MLFVDKKKISISDSIVVGHATFVNRKKVKNVIYKHHMCEER